MPTKIFEQAVLSLSPEQYAIFYRYVAQRNVMAKTQDQRGLLDLVTQFHNSVRCQSLSLAMIGYTTQEGIAFSSRSLDLIRGKG